jgi:NADH:ubiquinone oxidoreductase subunit K
LFLILSALLLLVSLSRSIMIAAAAWPLIAFARSARRYALSVQQIVLAYVTIAVAAVGLASGFALVLWNRFTTDTSSYQARETLYNEAFTNIGSHFLTGGVDTVGASSHNFVLDAWLRGGILVMLSAAAIWGMIVLAWIALGRRLHKQPDWMVPVVAALALPIVRLGTAGGGLINPAEWVTLSFVAGVIAMRWSRRSQEPGAATPAEAAPVEVAA